MCEAYAQPAVSIHVVSARMKIHYLGEVESHFRPADTWPQDSRMSSTLTVRPVTAADFPAWLPLWNGYNAFYGRHGETALPEAVTRLTWSHFFDAYEPMHALVAEDQGKLVGLAHYLFHRSTIQLHPSCYVQDLFTAETARGMGIGRTLIETVYRCAKQAGCPRVYWQTHETNTIAMQLYDKVAEKSGFVVYRKML